MQILEVNDRKTWKLFHKVPHRIHRANPVWICPIEAEVQAVFTPGKNKAFLEGEAQCFVLLDPQGKPAGRIAAFIDHERNRKQAYPTGGIGFFECIENEDYAYALFHRAAEYLSQWEVKAIDGPINFGEREKFTGLLVKGFEYAPLHLENYQPPYYERFFTAWGFRPFEQILTFRGKTSEVPFKRFSAIARRITSRYPVETRSPDLSNMDQLAEDFNEIYNSAFSRFDHFKPLNKEQTLGLFKDAKPIVDPKTSCFTYYDGRPASFCVLLPEVSPYLKSAKGKMNWWTILKLFLGLRFGREKPLKGIAFGVHQDFQGKGLFAVMVDFCYFQHKPDISARYNYFYLTTIRGHNQLMVDSVTNLGVKVNRVHIAYRKILDETLPFEPLAFVEVDD